MLLGRIAKQGGQTVVTWLSKNAFGPATRLHLLRPRRRGPSPLRQTGERPASRSSREPSSPRRSRGASWRGSGSGPSSAWSSRSSSRSSLAA